MNSPMKDALTEFINNNTSAIEQAMENGSHDLSKEDPVIPDLMKYLSCPSPQLGHKDMEPMSTSEKADTHHPSFESLDRQAPFGSHQLQDLAETNQLMASHTCVTSGNSVLNQVASLTHGLHHQQDTSVYSSSNIQPGNTACAFPESQLVNPAMFEGTGSSSNNSSEIHSSLSAGASESQYCHSEHCDHFLGSSHVDKQDQQTQLMSTDNCVPQLQPHSETSPSGFQDSLVLSSFTSSVNSEVSFGQDGLGFRLSTVSHDSRNNLESVADQFRAPEKMHVDEPEVIYQQSGSIGHFHAGAGHTASSSDVHMQAYSSGTFNASGQTATIADSHLQDSAASSATGQSFQQNPTVLQGCVDFQAQPNIQPAKDIITDQTHYVQQQPESSGSSEAPFSCTDQHACGSSHPDPYQANQCFNLPGHGNTAASVADTFQKSVVDTEGPAQGSNCGQTPQFDLISNNTDCTTYQQSASALQPHQLDLGQFHQSPALDISYATDVSLDHCQPQSSMSFHSSLASDLNNPVLFPTSAPAGSQNQPNDYLVNSVDVAASQVNDSTAFKCNISEDPLLSQTSVPQHLTEFQMSTSCAAGQGVTASSKAPCDVTMREFSLGGSLHSSSHRFTDDSFSHLDLEAVVNSLSGDTSSSTAPHSDPVLSTTSYQPSYHQYEYSRLAPASVSFSDTSTFNEQSKSEAAFTSDTPVLSTASFMSDSQFAPPSFMFAPSSEAAAPAYPQPMQVQDSEPHVTYCYPSTNVSQRVVNNTETAMDMSLSSGLQPAGLSSGMSYEEIHMSIVKAGNELSKETHDTSILDAHPVFDTSPAQTANSDTADTVSSMFPADKSDGSVAATYHSGAQSSAMMSSPGDRSHESNFSSEVSAFPSTSSLSDSLTGNSVNSSIFSGLLSDLQASAAPASHIPQQISAAVPNFLENTGPLLSSVHTGMSGPLLSSVHTGMSATSLTQGPAQSNFIITIAGTPTASTAVTAGQQPPVMLSSTVSQTASTPGSSQTLQTTASFLDSLEVIDSASGSLPAHQVVPTLGLAGASVDSASVATSGVYLHMDPVHVERGSVLPGSIKLATNTLTAHKSNTNSTSVASLASVSVPAVNTSQGLASSTSQQPHIIVSLEELQKLLAQQNLSQPSPSVPHQQPYTTLSSPQTLVLQKHASHSLKQSQPRLLIKGATLPSQPRLAHPQQPLQQARDKLHLLMHQPSEHISMSKLSHRSSETTAAPDNHHKASNPFHFVSVGQLDKLSQGKLHVLQHPSEQPAKGKLQLKPAQVFHRQPQTVNLFLQQVPPKAGDHKLAPLQLGQQQMGLPQGPQKSHIDHKPFVHIESHFQNPHHLNQRGPSSTPKTHNHIQLAQMQQELLLLLKQEEKGLELEKQQLQQLHRKHQQHLQPLDKTEKTERACSDSLRKDYKHLHSLLTAETSSGGSHTKAVPSVLNLTTNTVGLQLAGGGSSQTLPSATPTAPFSLIPLNSHTSLPLTGTSSSTPLSTLAFVKNIGAATVASKAFDIKDFHTEPNLATSQYSVKLEQGSSAKDELDVLSDHFGDQLATHQPPLLLQTSTERKRSHTPLSVDLNSPANSGSEPASPLSSPTICEDGNTQLTLIERSADLHIKSDTMMGVEDEDLDENASFDLNAFHKRPSAGESHSTRGSRESVPMKIAKSSMDTSAHVAVNCSTSPESTFDFGSAVTSASSFSFVFGNKEDNHSELFTFGLNGTATTAAAAATTDTLPHKDGNKPYRLASSKPVMKAAAMRAAVPTQSVRPTTRKQKEYSLKAYYPSKLDGMELKILEQPEPQHRARYQTEGSRGAIKDASQQGFPVVKLYGYSKPAKLQVFIGDECGRVKPHGFYQACRVFGKNSTACVEQEVEDTTVIEIEMLPDNDMTVKLDCVGILKLRNADVERRIGPKRAREKKKANTRARLVMRCLVDKSDGNQQILQAVSNPIVCTQPVGQPEISRMSLSESSVLGGDSLFIIGKNFKNKGTSVLFQKLDSSEESVVWQVEADIEQEFFQPTHIICKIPPYQDTAVEQPQLAQIVISCAGKRSDPQTFMYTPVYPVASSVKHDIPMDMDHTSSAQSVSFVSSDTVHLNRLPHPAPSTTIMFQPPQDSLTGRQTIVVEPTPANISSQISQPFKLLDHAPTTASVVVMTPSTTSARPVLSMTVASPDQGQPSFLLEDHLEDPAPETGKDGSKGSAVQSSVTGLAPVSCIVHSNSDTRTVSAVSYAVSDSHQQPCPTASAGQVLATDKPSANTSASGPNKPFFLVVDPVALQSNVASEKIQQLLQHILEAQSQA